MAGLCESGNEPPGSLKASKEVSNNLSKPLIGCPRLSIYSQLPSISEGRLLYPQSEDAPFRGDRESQYIINSRCWTQDRDSNPGHLVSRPDALTVTPQTTRHPPHGWGKPRKKPKKWAKRGSNPSPRVAPDQQPSESAD
ncbi:hypothetical protein ANN_13912 [Periplaneta americana]|uniref:Uncharacterized protein n=1 Tax=Periplaneta americana TaxID=6978 RepID=A0ABQ8SVV4_PERAM|nr:hypothetical protein ANN_13912 [Periplaneta americana]